MVNKVLRGFLKNCPSSSGVYQMFNEAGEIIYIGKAKNIYNRLTSYLRESNSLKIKSLNKIEVILTRNEPEAFLLEAKLIKKCKPKYNVLLKDDKSFPFIVIRNDHQYSQLLKYRGANKKYHDRYGPFPSSALVDKMLTLMQKAFLLRSCSDVYFSSRKRPCILYQIKKCSGPCVNKISKPEYELSVQQAKDFLAGRNTKLRAGISCQMKEASENYDYERAATLRDRLKAINLMHAAQSIEMKTVPEADVIAVSSDGVVASVSISFVRMGGSLGSKTYYPKIAKGMNKADIIEGFIGSFYQRNIPPKKILVNTPILDKQIIEDALHQLHNCGVKIESPVRGEKKTLIDSVEINSSEGLKYIAQKEKSHEETLAELVNKFNLAEPPPEIEIYDNSHIFGKSSVGGKVVWSDGDFVKSKYKKYNLENLNYKGGDDYEMFRQVLARRFKNKKLTTNFFIFDGGKGHLTVIKELLDSLDISINFICVSKGRDRNSGNETIYSKDGSEVVLDKKDKLKQFIQVLRDEAHRFAISSHRTRRKNKFFITTIDSIPGIGHIRRKNLLSHFGSIDAIKDASISDLKKVESISKNTAEIILKFFNKNKS